MYNDTKKYVDCYFCKRSVVDYLLNPIPMRNITRMACMFCRNAQAKGYKFNSTTRKWYDPELLEKKQVVKKKSNSYVTIKEVELLRAKLGIRRKALTLKHR